MENSIDKLVDISNRLDQIEQSAEWISREMVHTDASVAQAGALISVLADDIKEKIYLLVQKLEDTIKLAVN